MQKFFGTDPKIEQDPIIETFSILAKEKHNNDSDYISNLPYDETSVSILIQSISNGLSHEESLQKIKFQCITNFDILSKFGNSIQITEESIVAITIVIYINAISFIYTLPENLLLYESPQYLSIINSLCMCFDYIIRFNETSLQLKSNTYLFQEVLGLVFSEDQDYSSKNFKYYKLISSNVIRKILGHIENENCQLDKTFLPILLNLSQYILSKKPEGHVDDDIYDIEISKTRILSFLNKFLHDKLDDDKSIDSYKNKLFDLIEPEIKLFNSDALSIFAWMTYRAQSDKLTKFIENLPIVLIERIKQIDRKTLDPFDLTEGFSFNPEELKNFQGNDDQYAFLVKKDGMQTFPKGIESLPAVFDKSFLPLLNIFDKFHEIQNNISHLSLMLKNSQPNFSVNFFNKFPELLEMNTKTEENLQYFPLIFAAYMILLKLYELTKELLDSQIRGFGNQLVFDPKYLLFIEDRMPPLINIFRNEVFEYLIYTKPDYLIRIFDPSQPFLYAEHLGRILSKKGILFETLADNEQFCSDVIKVAKELQYINLKYMNEKEPDEFKMKLVSKARNCVFLFTFNIAQYKRFESKSFGPYFFDFLFESEITDIIIKIIEKYYIFYSNDHVNDDAVIGRIFEALSVCAKRSESDLHSN